MSGRSKVGEGCEAGEKFDAVAVARELFDAMGLQPTLRQMRLTVAALAAAERRGASGGQKAQRLLREHRAHWKASAMDDYEEETGKSREGPPDEASEVYAVDCGCDLCERTDAYLGRARESAKEAGRG